MLSNEQILKNKGKIIAELSTVKRKGMDLLLNYLEDSGYYNQASSTKYHQAYEGGNAEHAIEVFDALDEMNQKLNLGIPQESVILCSLLHDVCKNEAYIKMGDKYVWNNNASEGHGAKSVRIVESYIELTLEERGAIAYHMGAYERSEYNWNDLSESYAENKLSYYLHVADMRSTYGF